MTKYTRVALSGAVTALLFLSGAACGSSTPSTQGEQTGKGEVETPAPQKNHEIHKMKNSVSAEYDGVEADVTVLGYEQGTFDTSVSADEEFGTTDYVWAAAELKQCATRGTVRGSNMPWVLVYEDGSRIEPSSSIYGDFPKPEYPLEFTLPEGDCIWGKVVFAVPENKKPEYVMYISEAVAEPQKWEVP